MRSASEVAVVLFPKRNEERIQRASDELMSIGFNVRDVHPGNGHAFQFVRKLHYYFDD